MKKKFDSKEDRARVDREMFSQLNKHLAEINSNDEIKGNLSNLQNLLRMLGYDGKVNDKAFCNNQVIDFCNNLAKNKKSVPKGESSFPQ